MLAGRGRVLVAFTFVLAGCTAHSSTAPAPTPANPSAASTELFRFHTGVWSNLHQVLLHEAFLPRPGFESPKSLHGRSVAPATELTPAEEAPWRKALAYYDNRFTSRNLFADDVIAATHDLRVAADSPVLVDGLALVKEWRDDLEAAAPAYRAHFWPAHERADRAYIAAITPVVAAHGAWFVQRLSAVYETAWPKDAIDVEVTAVVPMFGASTVGEPPFERNRPLIIVSSLDPGYSGAETGLEMIFHESAHLLVGRVQELIDASAKRQDRKLPRALWHSVLFYTAGAVTREHLGPSYVPYADRPENHVFDGDWAPIRVAIARTWQPYLDGKTSMVAAIDALVASF